MGNITDPLHDYNLRAFPNLDPPEIELEVIGTPGSTTYTYVATFETIVGETTASSEESVTNGPDTLSSTDKVRITCESVPAAVTTINVFKKVGSEYHFLGSCDPDVNQVDDIGQSLDDQIQPPTTNDSGRNTWAFLGFHNNRCLQRPELLDLQGIFHRWVRDIADTIFRDGDQVSGCFEQDLGSDEWQFTDGEIYLQGIVVDVASDSVQLTGTGTELVGVWITPSVITYQDDPKIRNIDEGVGDTYNMEGADRIIIEAEWGLSTDTPPSSESFFVLVKEFVNGAPRTVSLPPEQSRLDERIARQRHDTSGSFVVRNFPVKIVDHDTDATKVYAKINAGKAYPEGYEVETIAPQFVAIPKARDTQSVNNSAVGAFVCTGGYVIGTTTENFDVDGLKVLIQIGLGSDHTVTFSGNGQTAAQVATQIEAVLNAVPYSGEPDLITCSDASGHLKLQAQDSKSLTLKAISGDAYTVLGLTDTKPVTYEPTGTRIYVINEPFVKAVTDINYGVEIVVQLTHNGITHIDDLGKTGVYDILGANYDVTPATAEKECHDSDWTYIEGTDFERIGNTISFAGMGGSEPPNGATYYVKFRYNHNATKGTRTLVRVTDATITKGAAGGSDTLVFTGGTAKRVIDDEVVGGLSGNASNVIKIERVNDSSGQSENEYPYQYKLVSNSTELEHEDSEIDWALSTDEPLTSATYYVTFLFWYHDVEGDVVVINSYDRYVAVDLAPDNLTELRDCLDFRTVDGVWPIDGDPPVFDYEYYLSRIDKLNLTKDGVFTRVPGAPAKYPTAPKEPSTGVCTHALIIPPYTYRNDHVVIQSLEAIRITQRGLNELKHRIERLEYYATMKVLEDHAVSQSAAEEAKGLFVDSITGQNRMDPQFYKLGVYHSAAIDRFHNCFRLPVSEQGLEITINEAASTNIAHVGRVVMFDYTESVYQQQPYASMQEYVNPDEVFSWVGVLTIDPEEDFYNDVEQIPAIEANMDGNYDAIINYLNPELARQITWGAWNRVAVSALEYYEAMLGQYMIQNASGARRIDMDAYLEHEDANRYLRSLMPDGGNLPWETLNRVIIGAGGGTGPATFIHFGQSYLVDRAGEYSQLTAEQKTLDLGDRVVDVSMEMFCRTKHDDDTPFYVNCTVKGMLPTNATNGDIDVGCEIDGVAVDTIPTGTSEAGASSYKGKTTIELSAMGDGTFKFAMPEGIPIGARQIKVVWVTDPDSSWCSAIFQSVGLRATKQGTVLGFQSVAERTETVDYKCGYQHTTTIEGMVDPLAQTFRVDGDTAYICSIELYFAGKDSVLPVTVEIHDTLNGYPQPNVIQTCTLPPSSVNVTEDGSTSTKFTFENIVGYEPGEYCIVVRANSLQYKVFVAELGGIDILTGNVIGSQAHWGVLFHSPNASTWQAWTKRDLKFKINESNFENDCQIVFDELTGIQASYLCTLVTQFMPLGCDMKWFYSTDGGSTYTLFKPGLDTELNSVATAIKLKVDITAAGGTFQLVEKYMGIVLLLNELNANYIGRNGQLDPNDPCNEVTIYVDLETDGVNGTGVRSVTPYFSIDDGIRWVEIEMPSDYEVAATNDKRMYEYKFQTPAQATVTDASNTTPIVITSAGHGFKNNSIVFIQNVGGNTAANGVRLVKNTATNTFDLYDPDTEAAIAGNGAYTSGGTVDLEDFTQCRIRFYLETSNRAVTPRGRNIRAICS